MYNWKETYRLASQQSRQNQALHRMAAPPRARRFGSPGGAAIGEMSVRPFGGLWKIQPEPPDTVIWKSAATTPPKAHSGRPRPR